MSIHRRHRPASSRRDGLKPRACGALLPLLLAVVAGVAPAQAQQVPPQIPRDGWKDCEYNDKPLACVDEQLPGGLKIRWKDGQSMTYRELSGRGKDPSGRDLLRDRLGGVWRRELYVQGNITLTNDANGNRIFVPLRFPCKPPLKGEVGYCRY